LCDSTSLEPPGEFSSANFIESFSSALMLPLHDPQRSQLMSLLNNLQCNKGSSIPNDLKSALSTLQIVPPGHQTMLTTNNAISGNVNSVTLNDLPREMSLSLSHALYDYIRNSKAISSCGQSPGSPRSVLNTSVLTEPMSNASSSVSTVYEYFQEIDSTTEPNSTNTPSHPELDLPQIIEDSATVESSLSHLGNGILSSKSTSDFHQNGMSNSVVECLHKSFHMKPINASLETQVFSSRGESQLSCREESVDFNIVSAQPILKSANTIDVSIANFDSKSQSSSDVQMKAKTYQFPTGNSGDGFRSSGESHTSCKVSNGLGSTTSAEVSPACVNLNLFGDDNACSGFDDKIDCTELISHQSNISADVSELTFGATLIDFPGTCASINDTVTVSLSSASNKESSNDRAVHELANEIEQSIQTTTLDNSLQSCGKDNSDSLLTTVDSTVDNENEPVGSFDTIKSKNATSLCGDWTIEEDRTILLQFRKEEGLVSTTAELLAQQLNGRTSGQILDRYEQLVSLAPFDKEHCVTSDLTESSESESESDSDTSD